MTSEDYKRGYDKAYELMRGDTYMYDSTRRLFEVAAKYSPYEHETLEFKHGFVSCVYDLFRC